VAILPCLRVLLIADVWPTTRCYWSNDGVMFVCACGMLVSSHVFVCLCDCFSSGWLVVHVSVSMCVCECGGVRLLSWVIVEVQVMLVTSNRVTWDDVMPSEVFIFRICAMVDTDVMWTQCVGICVCVIFVPGLEFKWGHQSLACFPLYWDQLYWTSIPSLTMR